MTIELKGPWKKGYALDLHTSGSIYLGDNADGKPMFDTTWTKIGKLVYRLKYQEDKSVIDAILKQIEGSIKLNKFDYIIPIPPSNLNRRFQPVLSTRS